MLIFCDLDESLIANDVSIEAILGLGLLKPFLLLKEVFSLEDNLKPRLKELALRHTNFDATTLPYRQEVLDYLAERKIAGDRIFLLTASHQVYADAVAEHLGIFEDAFGSTKTRNIKGLEKVHFIKEKFGSIEFAYIGDTKADLPIWQASARPVVVAPVNSSLLLNLKNPVLIEIKPNKAKSILKALRPQQWLKNCLLFLPIFLSEAPIRNSENLIAQIFALILAFVAFSSIASSVYLLNDIIDAPNDRRHPSKKNRSIAAGKISVKFALLLILLLLGFGLILAYCLGNAFFKDVVFYLALTTAYTFKLKKIPILDIIILALLYTLRILAGGAVAEVFVSQWLKAFSIFFFLSLASIKRATELLRISKTTGRGYHEDDYPIIQQIGVTSGLLSVLVLAQYINSNKGAQLYANSNRLWWICLFLLYWISRLWLLTSRGRMKDDPVAFAVTDKESYLILLGCIITVVLSI